MLFSNCYLFSTRVNLDNFIGILSSSFFSYSLCSCSYGRSWGNGNSCSYISIRGSFCSCLLTSLSTCCMSAESRGTCMPFLLNSSIDKELKDFWHIDMKIYIHAQILNSKTLLFQRGKILNSRHSITNLKILLLMKYCCWKTTEP